MNMADLVQRIKKLKGVRYNNQMDLARQAGVSQAQVSRFLGEKGVPQLDTAIKILNAVGASIRFPGENIELCRDIQLIPLVMPKKIDSLDYLAIPLLSDQEMAGPERFQENRVKEWIIVYRSHIYAIRNATGLFAVRIGAGQRNMVPVLNPADIILINPADRDLTPSGKIMVVRKPKKQGGEASVKRVSTHVKGKEFQLIYYSDNCSEYSPECYNLKDDFENDLDKAIVGRVVWAWSDVTKQ